MPLFLLGCAYQPAVVPGTGPARAELPVSFEARGLPRIRIEVGGKPVLLVLDTGSNDTVSLKAEVASSVGVRWTGAEVSTWDALGKVVRRRRYVLPRVDLGGGVTFANVEGAEDVGISRGDADGVLGLGLLRHLSGLFLDLGAPSLTVYQGGLPADALPGAAWGPVEYSTRYGILGTLTSGGAAFRVIWDTGASASVLKPGRRPVTRSERGKVGTGMQEREEAIPFARVEDLGINGLAAGPVEFAVLDLALPVDGILGQDVLKRHRVLLDFNGSRLGIAPR